MKTTTIKRICHLSATVSGALSLASFCMLGNFTGYDGYLYAIWVLSLSWLAFSLNKLDEIKEKHH